MDDIISEFFNNRQMLIEKQQNECKSKVLHYLKIREEIKKNIAIMICVLVFLKYDIERSINTSKSLDDSSIDVWTGIKKRMNIIDSLLCSNCYGIYKSHYRQKVDIHVITIDTSFPVSKTIKILDSNTKFCHENGDVCNGRIKHNDIHVRIDESTCIHIPCDYIQLPNDTISIEYSNMFYTRSQKGGKHGLKYKGFDRGLLYKLKYCLDCTMNLKNIENALSIAHMCLQSQK